MNKAVFFDRDGVLNVDTDYIKVLDEIKLYNEAANIIAYCRKQGFKTFIVTNQPIIARGFLSENQLIKLHQEFQLMLLNQNHNALIDKIYYCPHHPNGDIIKYKKSCECRKPKPGMLLNAAREFDINLKASYMIGDRFSDIIAGYLAGCKTIQCFTGKHTESMIQTDLKIPQNIEPDFIIEDISQLSQIILKT